MTRQGTETSRRLPDDRRTIVVLLVDDQRFVGVAIGHLLAAEHDIELHCCLAAADAIARANEISPTVILQDLALPDIDGLTMVRMFRANRQTAGTPIVVLSGSDDAETRARSIAEGANDYLVKVPTKHDLIACIRRHADVASGDPDLDATASIPATGGPERRTDETLDRSVIADFRQATGDGFPAFILTFVDQFMQEASSQAEVIRDAWRRHDFGALKTTAHNLKGCSLTIGAKRLGALCTQMEQYSDPHPAIATTSDLLMEFDREFARVRDALAAERESARQP